MKLTIDFAFEGFRLVRERPMLIVFWGLLTLVGFGIGSVVFWTLGGEAMSQLEQSVTTNDPQAMLTAYGKLGPAYAVVFPLNVLIQSVIACAVFRNVLGGSAPSFGGLRFGMDELRQIAVSILFYLLLTGIYIAALIPGTIIGVIAAMAVGQLGVFLGLIPTLFAVFYMIARLSLCFVQSFDQKSINMFGSWRLTQSQAAPLMTGYLVAIIMAALVFLLCFGIFGAGAILSNNGDFSTLQTMAASARTGIDGLRNPVMVAYLIASNAIMAPLLMAISFGAPAAAYKNLAGVRTGAETVF